MNLRDIVRNTFQRGGTGAEAAPNETCVSCGKPFHCGASLRGCWCANARLTDEQRARLRETYGEGHCLCRECLERAAAAQPNRKPSS